MSGFLSLVKPGLQYDQGQGADPNTGMPVQLPPIVKFFKNAALRGHQAALDEMSAVQPGTSDIQGAGGGAAQIPEPGQPDTNVVSDTSGSSKTPKFVQPSFTSVAGPSANGMPQQVNPAETKLGKLLHILGAAASGALNGYGQMTPAAGAEAARDIPFQRAQRVQALQAGDIQNQLGRAQIGMLPWQRAAMIANLQKTQAETGKNAAEGQKASAEAGAIPTKTALEQAQALASNYKEQNGILTDLRTGKPLTPNAAGMVETPADIAETMHVPAGTMLPAKQITEARNAVYGHLSAADPVVVAQIGNPPLGDPTKLAQWGKKAEAIKTRMSAAPRLEMTLARPVQVADDNNPGNTKFVTAGQAMSSGAAGPQSASVQVPKAMLKSATSGKIGDEINAFNTAMAHADLLKQAATALQNGDSRTLSSLKNRFKTEFGSPDLTDYHAVANAYSREITKMLSSGHMTDGEIGSSGATLPDNANLATIIKVVNSYHDLAASKMKQRQNQVEKGMQGKPNFPDETPAAPPSGGGFDWNAHPKVQ